VVMSLGRGADLHMVQLIPLPSLSLAAGNTDVEHILSFFTVANQRMYLLAQLKNQGLSLAALHVIFTVIVLSVITYALPSFAGLLSKRDKVQLDSLFRKAVRRGAVTFHKSSVTSYNVPQRFVTLSTRTCVGPLKGRLPVDVLQSVCLPMHQRQTYAIDTATRDMMRKVNQRWVCGGDAALCQITLETCCENC